MDKRDPSLCYCMPSPGTRSRLGHVHGAPLSAVEWAKGIMAIAELAGDSKVIWLRGLPKAAKQAKRILDKA